jgi:hypothetical protein
MVKLFNSLLGRKASERYKYQVKEYLLYRELFIELVFHDVGRKGIKDSGDNFHIDVFTEIAFVNTSLQESDEALVRTT